MDAIDAVENSRTALLNLVINHDVPQTPEIYAYRSPSVDRGESSPSGAFVLHPDLGLFGELGSTDRCWHKWTKRSAVVPTTWEALDYEIEHAVIFNYLKYR
jgi:hypothetical protein